MNKRKITSLNGEWLFIDQDVTAAFGKDYDDSGWYHVDVPHDWAISRPFNKDTPCGSSQGYFDRWGVGWYRNTLNLTKYQKRAFGIDGVYEDSTVWVNRIKVGGWASDIPDFLRYHS